MNGEWESWVQGGIGWSIKAGDPVLPVIVIRNPLAYNVGLGQS